MLEDTADALALEVLKIIRATGDDACVQKIADSIGGSSQTMEEAFLTAVRVRRAEERARAMIKDMQDAIVRQLPPADE